MAVKVVAGVADTGSAPVRMVSAPTLNAPIRPVSRPPTLRRHLPAVLEPDAAAVEQDRGAAPATEQAGPGAPEGEQPLIFEEELALLGEEEAETREVDLLLVRFHLREVGVEGHVSHQVLGDPVLHVEPDVSINGVRHGGRGHAIAREVAGHERFQLEGPTTLGGHLQTDQRRGQGDLGH